MVQRGGARRHTPCPATDREAARPPQLYHPALVANVTRAFTPSPPRLTTAELQGPTDYTGIYRSWNVDLDRSPLGDEDDADDLWDFGTATQYPVLSVDVDDTAGVLNRPTLC